MQKGIWTLDLSIENLLRLSNKGFNKLFIPIGYFYNSIKEEMSVVDKQKKTAELMYSCYEEAKRLGFKYFIIDFGWGLGKLDGNYFYLRIFTTFKDCNDVRFYFGEPIEGLIEGKGYSWAKVKDILDERYELAKGKVLFDATARNFEKLHNEYPKSTTLSSYMFVKKHWQKGVPTVWFMGDPKIDFIGGCYFYKCRMKLAKRLGITDFMLYEANVPEWSSDGWEKMIFKLIHLLRVFNSWMQNRFLKYSQ